MKQRGYFILLIILFPLTLALAYIFRETIRQVVLMPILYLLWVINILYQTLGQQILWIFMLVLLLWLVLRNLRPDRTEVYLPSQEARIDSGRGRVSFWAWQVRMIGNEAYSKNFSMEELRRLILTVLAFQEQISLKQVERRLESGELVVPPEVQAVLETGVQPETFQAPALRVRIRRLLRRLIHQPDNRKSITLTPEVERVIQYLEERLEVSHAYRNF